MHVFFMYNTVISFTTFEQQNVILWKKLTSKKILIALKKIKNFFNLIHFFNFSSKPNHSIKHESVEPMLMQLDIL